jgi:3',5'-cyclic-AMP phosphodiesterase
MHNEINDDIHEAAGQQPKPSRRSLLASLAGAGTLLAGGLSCVSARDNTAKTPVTKPAGRRRSIRFAHFTDVHVQPERDAGGGMAECLRHIHAQPDAPSLILNTGDCVFDSFGRDAARTDLQWSLFQRVMKEECTLPVASCLGNHDIWGWNKSKSKTTGTEPLWGKRRALEALGLDKPYHSFDRGGWHFIMLDSMVPFGADGYSAKIDAEQFEWLTADLAANAGKHTLVASHIPIFSPAGVLISCGEDAKTPGRLSSNGGLVHLDTRQLHELFLRAGNVRACISGHLHLIDHAEFCGITYLSNPAISGNWWKGKHLDRFGEMYTLIDLFDDGTLDVEYVPYGWTAKALPDDKPSPPYPPPATQPTTVPTTMPTTTAS